MKQFSDKKQQTQLNQVVQIKGTLENFLLNKQNTLKNAW